MLIAFPESKGYSVRNLKYMAKFAETYPDREFVQQVVAQIPWGHNIVPFIIEDNLKMFYYRGLKEWDNEKGYLTDTCLTAQDRYKAYLDYFRIAY